MKNYDLIFEDKKGNELTRKSITAINIKEARVTRDKELANSLINDLHKIKVKPIKNQLQSLREITEENKDKVFILSERKYVDKKEC